MQRSRVLIGSVTAIALCWTLVALAQEKPAAKPDPAKPAAQDKGDKPAGKAGDQDEPGDRGGAKKPLKEFPMCPVMGEAVDFSVKTETEDGVVYFCCDMCIPKYTKDPKKYADKVAAQRKLLEKMPRIQVACPVSGHEIDGKSFVEAGGKKVYFCCDDCKPKYEKDAAKYSAKLAGCYTYQTKCPISGKPIDPTAYKTLATKQRIYFCCEKCPDMFMKDPAKYAPKLEEQHVSVDVTKLKGGGG